MTRTIVIGALFLCLAAAVSAQAPQQPAPAAQPQAQPPEEFEEPAYVRRFSAGLTMNLSPFPQLATDTTIETFDQTPPLEIRSNVDPNTRIFGYGLVAQFTLSERLAVAVSPTIKKFDAHTRKSILEGVDNASTSFDDRDKTDTDELITGRHIDIPILLRLYSKGHHERGARWIFEGGPAMRLTRSARIERRTFPPEGGEIKETLNFPSKNGFGVTAGIGGQFIDDFGIRAIPEVRFTRWITKSLDAREGRTRANQIEFLFTLSF